MINVKYDKPKKLASPQSIFVSFNYKQSIVDVIRTVPERYWDGKNKVWELSYDTLNLLQENLKKEKFNIVGEPINNKLYGEKLIENVYDPSELLKTKMFQYQIDGYNEMLNFDKYLLLFSQGLGKTICSIAVALKRKELNNIKHCLIICGVNGLKYNWQEEIKKHTGMNSMILGNRKNKKGVWNTGSNADKLEDLNNLNEFFIITNVESLRDKDIRNKLKILFDKHIIDMCVVDELHKCFDYNTNILTNKGYLKIGDIVTKNLDVLVASYNEKTCVVEYKKILNRFENNVVERKIRLKIENRGHVREIICTENHLIYTKNRGWVKAKDLDKNDELLDYVETDKVCQECGKPIHVSYGRCRKGIMFCSRKCSAIWRWKHYEASQRQKEIASNNLKKLWKDDEFRKRKSLENKNRMLLDNPVYKDGVVEKAKRTRQLNGGFSNNFKWGNGKVSPHEYKVQKLLPESFIYNYPIRTQKLREDYPERRYPTNYKPDFVNIEKKICIEVDGSNHNTKKGKLLDEKKDKCLELLGYKVLRFTHSEIDSADFEERLIKCLENF